MTKAELILLEQAAQAAEKQAHEAARAQVAAIDAAKTDGAKKVKAAEDIHAAAKTALGAAAKDAPNRKDLEAAVKSAAAAAKQAKDAADAAVNKITSTTDTALSVANATLAKARAAYKKAKQELVDEQAVHAEHLVRYKRMVPSDAATAQALLKTFEPEAVALGEQAIDAEAAKVAQSLEAERIAPFIVPEAASRTRRRKP